MKYTIVKASTTIDLAKQVEKLIEQGYVPVGGAFLYDSGYCDDYGQYISTKLAQTMAHWQVLQTQ